VCVEKVFERSPATCCFTPVGAQIEDDGVHVAKEIHGGHRRRTADGRIEESVEFQIPDV
jgi:hypothetical protein